MLFVVSCTVVDVRWIVAQSEYGLDPSPSAVDATGVHAYEPTA